MKRRAVTLNMTDGVEVVGTKQPDYKATIRVAIKHKPILEYAKIIKNHWILIILILQNKIVFFSEFIKALFIILSENWSKMGKKNSKLCSRNGSTNDMKGLETVPVPGQTVRTVLSRIKD